MSRSARIVSLVLPVYGEEPVLAEFHHVLPTIREDRRHLRETNERPLYVVAARCGFEAQDGSRE